MQVEFPESYRELQWGHYLVLLQLDREHNIAGVDVFICGVRSLNEYFCGDQAKGKVTMMIDFWNDYFVGILFTSGDMVLNITNQSIQDSTVIQHLHCVFYNDRNSTINEGPFDATLYLRNPLPLK